MRMVRARSFGCAALLLAGRILYGQGILGNNLIVNGGAESGSAGTPTSTVSTIPGWTRSGNTNVLAYNLSGHLSVNDPAPADHGFQYFYSGETGAGASTLTQTIDVSSGSAVIGGGNVRFTASAYLGSLANTGRTAQLQVEFQNAGGQTFTSVTLGPLAGGPAGGTSLQQAIGLVPSGTQKITVILSFNGALAAADSLSLVLTTLGTSPGSVLGSNLVVNPGAETGPSAPKDGYAPYIPGWSVSGNLSVAPYGGTGWILPSSPGPANRGTNLFAKVVPGDAVIYQDIDVSPAASLIDAGQITFAISGWLGGLGGVCPTLVYTFFDWSGKQVAPTATLGPVNHSDIGLTEVAHSGPLPAGTRRVNITLNFLASTLNAMADNIGFTLAAPPGPPVITPAGVISAGAFGGFSAIAPGSWIEIYGFNFAPATQTWASSDFVNGVAPTSLGGVNVSIGGKNAFLDYVSSGQINAQVPSDVSPGTVPITVTNTNGTSDPFWLYVNATEPGVLAPPNFIVNGKQYVAALFSDGQTFALPQGAIPGVPSRPAKPGDTLVIYGVGFGPVNTGVPAGTIVPAQNTLTAPIQFTFGTAAAPAPSYAGLAVSFVGLYQFNVVVPTVASNDALPLTFTLGGTKATQTLYVAVQN